MTDEEREWLDWAVLAGGTMDVPLGDASNPALISLISNGYLTAVASDEAGNTVRYTLTDKAGFRAGLGPGPGKLPDDIDPI